MKVTLNWLKQYVDFDWSAEELSERLTLLGIEVESLKKMGGEFEGIVVAQVITRDKHPNADKLSLCRVNDGKTERQIICGASNFKPGDKVPLILPGASLPAAPGQQPFTIKVGKIRGVESQGMMCSPQELGLPDPVDGLLILNPAAKVGQRFAEYLGRSGSDAVYDLEITPNRPDLNSVIGIAREIAALTGNALKLPESRNPESSTRVEEMVSVRIEDPELCPRYTARVIRGVKIGPSPDWLKSMLEKTGVRSINNVVDVTNYVMLETGQPLHAFDYHLLQKPAGAASNQPPSIVVRCATEGEKFRTLDGQERTLTQAMLLIADETKAVALAGIMGGQNSEISPSTVDVLLESAYFKPQNIRATSKKLELRTESSYRFERGADVEVCAWASQRATQLIHETASGSLAAGVIDAYPKPRQPVQITLRHAKVNELLGIQLKPEEIDAYLAQLGLSTARKPRPVASPGDAAEPITFGIPSFRVDLKREVDLIEEVARMHGIDKIPSTPPRGAIGSNSYDAVQDQLGEIRRILSGLGLFETQGQTLISETAAKLITESAPVALSNPLSRDMSVLRPSLLPGLLEVLRHNVNRKTDDIAVFELGRIFTGVGFAGPKPGQKSGGTSTGNPLREERRLAIAITGRRNPVFWSGDQREAKMDAHDLKGILEGFFEQFGVRGVTYGRRSESTPLFIESANVNLGKFPLGEFGLVQPGFARQYDLRDAVLVAELNLETILARRNPAKSFVALPAFPSIRRDVAMLVPESTTHDEVLQVVRQAKPANLESIELFDVFRGKHVPAGQKSMAYAFIYRHSERTLVDAEVKAVHDALVAQFRSHLQAVVRE